MKEKGGSFMSKPFLRRMFVLALCAAGFALWNKKK